jgi:hypothetical protein
MLVGKEYEACDRCCSNPECHFHDGLAATARPIFHSEIVSAVNERIKNV